MTNRFSIPSCYKATDIASIRIQFVSDLLLAEEVHVCGLLLLWLWDFVCRFKKITPRGYGDEIDGIVNFMLNGSVLWILGMSWK